MTRDFAGMVQGIRWSPEARRSFIEWAEEEQMATDQTGRMCVECLETHEDRPWRTVLGLTFCSQACEHRYFEKEGSELVA